MMNESASNQMGEKESRRVKTLSGFMKWTKQFNDRQYLFRGVTKDCYAIEASTYRRLQKNEDKTLSNLLKINKKLIEDARLMGHDQKDGQRLSDLDLLAELQHFGAATCLIDFTRDALVALWFACQQSSKGSANGKVFAVRSKSPRFITVDTKLIEKNIDYFLAQDPKDVSTQDPKDFYAQDEYLYQWQPKHQNNRIIAQKSIFVFGSIEIATEAECVIIKSSKQEILKSLDKLSGITEASMFPDFDGFARLHAQNKPHIEADIPS